MQALLGIPLLLLLAWGVAERRRPIMLRVVIGGLFLQASVGLLLLKVPAVREGFEYISRGFVRVLDFSHAGAEFLFGNLVRPEYSQTFGYIFVLQVLPTVIFFSALTSALYYLGILQVVVKAVAWVMRRTLGTSGPESLCVASNIFLGQTEAPLLIRPFLGGLSRSELLAIMVGGMATLAGGVLAAYVGFLGGNDPILRQKFALHLMAASVMNAPAALVFAKLLLPETDPEVHTKPLRLPPSAQAVNILEALAQGASDGLRLAANIAAMLLAFIATLALVDYLLLQVGEVFQLNQWIQTTSHGLYTGLSLEWILGQIFRPIAWLIGVEWRESLAVGALIGQKIVINEFIAYTRLAELSGLSEKARIITTYALSGFANFSSIAIQLGGIGSLVPERRRELAELGLRAVLGGALASLLSACWAGLLI
ncbi:MAG: NupC/NupG family nucleoside CNT transporter [Bacteroidia bacterium]|nr:NupC/NupG family nucleoside CNT transporter [Bacteroidia bacterium]MCX7763520.1 NupC/NupG family nucleoside CNT transporter [Bacteroidia bacterium]MDW8057476.1 nucleoside transporter C-terminal domain-containing protein [Bacteroidia bacterium]